MVSTTRFGRLTYKLSIFFFSLIFIIPPIVPVHLFPMGSFWTEWSAGVLVILAWSFLWLNGERKAGLSHSILPWLLWGGALFVSAYFAKYYLPSPVYMALIFWAIGALALLMVGELKREYGFVPLVLFVAQVLLLSGLLQSLLGIARYYGLLSWFTPLLHPLSSNRMNGLINYPTIAGFSLWLSIYAAVYLFWKKKITWYGLVLAAIVMGSAIIATGDRSSILYGTAMLVLALVNAIRLSGKNASVTSLHIKQFVLPVLALGVLFALLYPATHKADAVVGGYMSELGYMHRDSGLNQGFSRRKGETFIGLRGSEFEKAIYLARSHLWAGVGPGNYPYQSFRLDSVLKNTVREGTINSHSHNIFSMILIEEGVLGLIALVVGMCLLGVWWWRLGANSESAFLGAMLASFFIFSNLEFPLWYLNFLVIFLIVAALTAPVADKRFDHSWVKPSLAIVMLVVGLGIALNMGNTFKVLSYDLARPNLLSEADKNRLVSITADRFMQEYALFVYERRALPLPVGMDSQLKVLNRIIHTFPISKALLDKAILLQFKGQFDQACNLARQTAYSYPTVLIQFSELLGEYRDMKKKLPHDPSALKPCFEEGKAGWKKQWGN